MTTATPIIPAILALMLSAYSSADELTDATEGLCDTIKTCALEAVAGQDLTDRLRKEMTPVLDKSCAELRSQVQTVPPGHKLYQPAVDCVSSMSSLSCQQLHDAGEIKTPECTEYDRLVKAAGAETP